ncbi:radical SAM protein [Candidatus Woesearchaeota archaeon]|nr:radical SAM protein [Candidatus Woesearchaeota archaeon]
MYANKGELKVLLIVPGSEFDHIDVPLGPVYLATYVSEKIKNSKVQIFDKNIKFLNKKLQKFKPDVVGIYSTIVQLNLVKKYISIIRSNNTATKIILGGPTTVSSAIQLEYLNPDVITISEGEIPFTRYLQNINDISKLKKIPNLIIKTENGFFKTPTKPEFINLEEVKLPDFSFINVEKYIKKWYYFEYFGKVRGVSLMTSRGCPFRCTFCQPIVNEMFGSKVRYHSIKDIVEKMQELKNKYNMNYFFFHDDTFTLNKKRVIDFCNEIRIRDLNIRWGCNTRVNSVDLDTLKIMKKSGCVEIRLGIETYNQKTLNLIQKDTQENKINPTIDLIKKAKINSLAFIMIGFPNEGVLDTLRTLVKASSSNLDFMRISILTCLPGTQIAQQYPLQKQKCENYNYIKHSINNPSKLSNSTLEFLKIIGYFLFYLNPKRLLKTFSIVNSPSKLLSKLERI